MGSAGEVLARTNRKARISSERSHSKAQGPAGAPRIDFAANAASLGATAENVKTIPELEAALTRARAAERTSVICIETDPARTTDEGGWWWEVAVPEVSERETVRAARKAYVENKRRQQP